MKSFETYYEEFVQFDSMERGKMNSATEGGTILQSPSEVSTVDIGDTSGTRSGIGKALIKLPPEGKKSSKTKNRRHNKRI